MGVTPPFRHFSDPGTPALPLGMPALHLAPPAVHFGCFCLPFGYIFCTPALQFGYAGAPFGSIWHPFGILLAPFSFNLVSKPLPLRIQIRGTPAEKSRYPLRRKSTFQGHVRNFASGAWINETPGFKTISKTLSSIRQCPLPQALHWPPQ